eukprot:6180932-Pleurochrysis_carterae.AAC.1
MSASAGTRVSRRSHTCEARAKAYAHVRGRASRVRGRVHSRLVAAKWTAYSSATACTRSASAMPDVDFDMPDVDSDERCDASASRSRGPLVAASA